MKIDDLSNQMNDAGTISGIITFSAIVLHHIYKCWHQEQFLSAIISLDTVHTLIQALLITFTIDIALPEGLPLSVTLTLSYGERRMKESNLLVRYLQVGETMGGVHSLCCSKTGVITKNLLSVTKLWVEDSATNIVDR